MSSKAAELLENLNNQVRHEGGEASPSKNLPLDKPPLPVKKEQITNRPQQNGEDLQLHAQPTRKAMSLKRKMSYQQSHEPPQCLVDILTSQIGTQITAGLSEVVETAIKQREKYTYESMTGDNLNYIQGMLDNSKKKNEINLNLIDSLMAQRVHRVEDELEGGGLEVIPEKNISNKKQLEYLTKLDVARMIKIKEGELRSKMDLLHEKMSNIEAVQNWDGTSPQQSKIEQQVRHRLVESMDAGNYSLDSQKTRIARDYVKYMHHQRKLLQKRKKQRQSRYDEHDKERESELNEAMQMKDLAKRQEILERIEIRRKKREEEEQAIQAKEQEVNKFLAEYHKKNPIYKQKQKQFEQRYVKPEQRLRQQKLQQIRQGRKSMSLSDIKSHEQKYLSKLQNQKSKRKQQFKLILKSRQLQNLARPYYKGQIHKRMDQITKQDQKRSQSMRQASKLKSLRMKEYSEVIHTKHKPNVDEEKKQQLMNYIQADVLRKKKIKKMFKQVVDQSTQEVKLVPYYEPLVNKDYKSEGKRYFIQAKKLAKKKDDSYSEKMQEEEAKESRAAPSRVQLLKNGEVEGKKKDIWQVRAKQLEQMAGSDIVDAQNFEYVKNNIENLDKKAAEKQDLMKQVNLPMEDHIKEKGLLDRFYLQSIKQKMKLLE